MLVRNITIGADPELFIIDSKTGKVVSSIGLIPGVKGEPYVGEDMPNGFGLETDNILAEFNIPPVKDCAAPLAPQHPPLARLVLPLPSVGGCCGSCSCCDDACSGCRNV